MPTEQEQRNIDTALAYLAAIDAFDPDRVAQLLAEDGVQREFPNTMTPSLRERSRDDVLTGTREAAFFLSAQRHEVSTALASGDTVSVEGVWTGVLKVELGPLKVGDTLRAYIAQFFTFRGGAIAVQSNHWSFELPPQ